MDPERWARAKELFHEALDREPAEREPFLRGACAGDEPLRQTVAAMLARQADAREFLESPALQVEALALARDLGARGAPVPESSVVPEERGIAGPIRPAQSSRPPWWIYVVAAAFVADFLLRAWCFDFGPAGFEFTARAEAGRHVVVSVGAGGAAERAGMQPGDVLLARDGRPYAQVSHARVTRQNLEVGRSYRFDVERDGERRALTIVMPRIRILSHQWRDATILWQVAALALLATALLIAFKRPRDPLAGMGALTLATLSASMYLFNFPAGYAAMRRGLPWIVDAWLWIPTLGISLVGPIGLTFFASFPRPLFRARWPWVAIWLPALCLVPVDVRSTFLVIHRPDAAYAGFMPDWIRQVHLGLFAMYGFAMLAAVTANYFRLTDITEKRRLRVLIAGGAVGTLPALARIVVMALLPRSTAREYLLYGWPDVPIAAGFLLFPICFGYAILRHRLFGIRVLVRLGARYALARGALISLVPVLGLIFAVDAVIHGDEPLLHVLADRGWVYGTLGALAVVAHALRRRWITGIDRRFFREHYDTGHLLRDVAEQARRVGSLERAAPAVVAHIETALHPEFAAVLFRPTGEPAFRCTASAPSGLAPPAISVDSRIVALLRASEEPLELSERGTNWLVQRLPGHEIDDLRRARVDLLVPIVMGLETHEAVLAFGAKRSEEPYSHEDKDALSAIASSLALLLDRPTPRPDRPTSAFAECPQCGTCYDTGTSACERERTPLVPVHMPRTLAGRYRLEKRLGRGGMGKVYEATDHALGRRVAVKLIRDEWVHSADAAHRFRQEVRAVAGFAHPNVVTVHDYGVEAGSRAFLVMELLDGTTLRDELRRSGRLDAARAVEVFRGVCSAVDAAHRRQLVHRDLKPENIFLVRGHDGDRGTVKVLDFGIAKALPGGDEAAEADGEAHTDAGVLVGTIGYMSPEQLMGEPPGLSWDLWALAVVAYESVAGALPFSLASRDTWRQAVLDGRRIPLGEHVANPPNAWQDFFARALATDRASRPGSAAELFRQFEHAFLPVGV